jgi:hypothetical protein
VWHGNGSAYADLIQDKLWLPTELELFGFQSKSDTTYETAADQARLEYYITDWRKYNLLNYSDAYWLASPSYIDADCFCFVRNIYSGEAYYNSASSSYGCVPAFCVK